MRVTPAFGRVLSRLKFEGRKAAVDDDIDNSVCQKVNAALEEMGARWAHGWLIFPRNTDALAAVGDAIDAGVALPRTEEATAYERARWVDTPPRVSDRLVRELGIRPTDSVLEPSSGGGEIVRAIHRVTTEPTLLAVEEHAHQAARTWEAIQLSDAAVLQRDFFDAETQRRIKELAPAISVVAMAPPFAHRARRGRNYIDHVMQAWSLLAPGGRLGAVLPAAIEWREDWRAMAFRAWCSERGGRFVRLAPDAYEETGTTYEVTLLLLGCP